MEIGRYSNYKLLQQFGPSGSTDALNISLSRDVYTSSSIRVSVRVRVGVWVRVRGILPTTSPSIFYSRVGGRGRGRGRVGLGA